MATKSEDLFPEKEEEKKTINRQNLSRKPNSIKIDLAHSLLTTSMSELHSLAMWDNFESFSDGSSFACGTVPRPAQ